MAMLSTKALTPGMINDLSAQYDQMMNPMLQSTGDPYMDAKRQEMYAQNAAMQQNQIPAGPLRVDVGTVPIPKNEMVAPPMDTMTMPQMNAMLTKQPENLLDAVAAQIAAPKGEQPLGQFVSGNWQDLLRQGVAGLEENAMRENLPADVYMKMKTIENEKTLAEQNQFLNNLKLQADLDYQRQSIDLKKEELAMERQKALTGGSGSSYMEDAKILMGQDPSLDLNSAYALARSGLERGIVMGADGIARPIAGYGEASAGFKGQGKTAETLASTQASAFTEGQLALPKVVSKAKAFEDKNGLVNDKIESLKKRAGTFTTGFGGSLFSAVPGTPAYDLAQDTKTLQAQSGFTELQEMRDNSPTGGALGSVAVQELELLQAAQQNLLASQSMDQYLANLESYKELRRGTATRLKAAAERDKALFGGTYEDYQKILNKGMAPFLEEQSANKASVAAPSGVDPALLEFMSPEERALFQ